MTNYADYEHDRVDIFNDKRSLSFGVLNHIVPSSPVSLCGDDEVIHHQTIQMIQSKGKGPLIKLTIAVLIVSNARSQSIFNAGKPQSDRF